MVMEGGIIDIDTKNLFNQALQLHSAGSLNSAEKIYKEILEKQVDHAEANHNLGLIFVEKNQLSKALNFFKYALDSSPSVSLFWGSYIEVLVGLKRVDEATKLINHLKSANITSEKIEKISEHLESKFKTPNTEVSEILNDGKLDYVAELKKWESNSFEKTDEIMLSICIPTYNRARYLDALLSDLFKELQDFPFSYEIVISDDSSQDDTDDVVNGWIDKLPILYDKQKENVGYARNIDSVYSLASGVFAMYLADDDFIDKDGLIEAILMFIAHPNAVVLYAPWKFITLQNKDSNDQFYEIPNDIVLEQFDYLNLLQLVLDHHIFPEVLIFRLDTYNQLLPLTNDLSYWAFTKATEWLSLGQIIFKKEPFYCLSLKYFEEEERVQVGTVETQYAWDRYRGGLEHMLSYVAPSLTAEDRLMFRESIHSFVARRMYVGLQFRLANEGNPIESYYLANRICGMVNKDYLPCNYDLIREAAAIYYLGNDPKLLKNKNAIILVGFEKLVVDRISGESSVPVFNKKDYAGEYKDLVIFYKQDMVNDKPDLTKGNASNNIILTESILMNKFQ